MDKHEQAVRRGEEAQRLLNSEMLSQAFADTRAACLEALAKLPVSGDDALNAQQKDLLRMVKLVDTVQKCIREHVESGKLAHKHIESVAKRPFLKRVGF